MKRRTLLIPAAAGLLAGALLAPNTNDDAKGETPRVEVVDADSTNTDNTADGLPTAETNAAPVAQPLPEIPEEIHETVMSLLRDCDTHMTDEEREAFGAWADSLTEEQNLTFNRRFKAACDNRNVAREVDTEQILEEQERILTGVADHFIDKGFEIEQTQLHVKVFFKEIPLRPSDVLLMEALGEEEALAFMAEMEEIVGGPGVRVFVELPQLDEDGYMTNFAANITPYHDREFTVTAESGDGLIKEINNAIGTYMQ